MPAMNIEELNAFIHDETAGAGNFVVKALAISRFPNEPIVYPDLPYVSLSGKQFDSLSLRDLDTVAGEFASFYRDRGVTPKDVVAVYLDDDVDYLIQYLAITRLGAVAALINGNLPAVVAAPYIMSISASGAMVSLDRHLKLKERLADHGILKNLWIRSDVQPGDLQQPSPPYFVHEDSDPVLITHTSGTTGFPKAVTATHKAFFHGVKYRLAHPMEGLWRYFCALPLSHNSSVACMGEPIVRGCPVRVQARKEARLILQSIEAFKPHIVVAFPKQFVDMCRVDLGQYNLSSVQYWRSTGDGAHERHVKLLTAVGTTSKGGQTVKGSTYIDGLGSSEMGSSLFYIQFDSSSRDHFRCVGRPQPWVTAAVLDENSRELGANCVGRLGVRTPSLTPGYWNNSALTEKARENGYWITGDLVYRDTEGNYYHVDRLADRIDTEQGPLYSLLTEEHILSRFPDVFECCVYGVLDPTSGKQFAVVQVEILSGRQTTEYLTALLSKINQYLKSRGMPRVSRIVQDLRYETYAPEGVTGKILKRMLRENSRPTTAVVVRE